jgi:hypothetical protein
MLPRPIAIRHGPQLEVAICDLKIDAVTAAAFTEHGAVMLASVLNSPVAVTASVEIVRAFIRLRELLATHKDLARRLDELEAKYDDQFTVVFDAVRKLMAPPKRKPREMGYHTLLPKPRKAKR